MGVDLALSRTLGRLTVSPADERRSHVYRSYPEHVPRLAVDRLRKRDLASLCGSLARRLRDGAYAPAPAYVAARAKRDGTAGRHEILTIEDRIIYEALVRPVRPLVEAGLCPPGVLFGPRGMTSILRWASFVRSPVRASCPYVVLADVANAWASMRHERIARSLIAFGCERATVDAIVSFLGMVMEQDQGLPVRLGASECLATALLSTVDHEMTTRGWRYTRCADDMLIAVETEAQADEVLGCLADSLRSVGLSLREDRTRVIEGNAYAQTEALGWRDLVWERVSMCGDGRYLYGTNAVALRNLGRCIRASRARLANAVGSAEAATAPEVSRREAARMLTLALELATSRRDPAMLPLLDATLARSPDLTEPAARYLRALLAGMAAEQALESLAMMLCRDDLLDTQRAWFCRALVPSAPALADHHAIAVIERAAASPDADWVLRTEAARVLVARKPGRSVDVRQLAAVAPPQFDHELRGMASGPAPSAF